MPRACSAFISALLIGAGWGCATPVPPSGGPADETPPEIVETRPAQGAVNVDAESIRITFSEYVDEASLPRALSVSPAFLQPLDYSWSGRSVDVGFPEPLRENTTYVLTIDTNLRDARNVALRSPIIMAFSTGPTISAGHIGGRLVSPDDGAALPGIDVFAYARPDSSAPAVLPESPAYATQTDESGTFSFEYLTEQFYYVVAVEDANRNRRPDPQEAFAAPPVPALFADTLVTMVDLPWLLARIDTTAPGPLRVQSLSQSRHAIRYSEPVRLATRESDAWAVSDSSSGELIAVESIYQRSEELRDVIFTTSPLNGERRYQVEPAAAAVVDTSGNPAQSIHTYFSASSQLDTLQTRFETFLPPGTLSGSIASDDSLVLPAGVEPGLRFNAPPDNELMTSAVIVSDAADTPRAYAAVSSNGTDYEILPDPELQPGEAVRIAIHLSRLAGPDTVRSRLYERLSLDEVGEISGAATVVPAGDAPIVVQLIPVEVPVEVPEFEMVAEADGAFIFRDLPAGTYRVRAFLDEYENGRWDPGMLTPYRPAERIEWGSETVRVRARWDTAMPDTLQISDLG